MVAPLSGGLNQRERKNSDSLERTSGVVGRQHAVFHRAPDERQQKKFAPRAGARFRRQQHRDVGILQPQVAQRIHRQIVAERARQHGAVDAAGGRAGDDIDDHAQFDLAADLAQQLEIDRLGIVFRIVDVGVIEIICLAALAAIRDGVKRRGTPHQLEDFLADAVHVDGERNAAEADERDAKFLLAHESPDWDVSPAPELPDSGVAPNNVISALFHRRRGLDPYRLIAAVRQCREDLFGVCAVARFDCHVEPRALGRHIEKQATMIDFKNIGVEPARAAWRSDREFPAGRGWSAGTTQSGRCAPVRAP